MGIRHDQASLTPAQRTVFVNAVLALKANGVYDTFVAQHRAAFMAGPNDPAHNGPAFLPWHREFLRRFERALQSIDPSVSLPYWDWSVDNSTSSSLWDANFMGGDGNSPDRRVTTGPFAFATGRWTLTVLDPRETRNFLMRRLSSTGRLPTQQEVEGALGVVPYDKPPWHFQSPVGSGNGFRAGLEGGIHNPAHTWVGGSMVTMSSPNDPVFWLHHCNIDRLWAKWQYAHPAEPYVPTSGTPGVVAGHALDDPMRPWAEEHVPPTPRSVLDHHALGYWYDTDVSQVAFQANNGNLWVNGGVRQSGTDTTLRMRAYTSPSVAALPNGRYVIAFQADTGNLWVVDGTPRSGTDMGLGMMAGTSPSVAPLTNGRYVIAFQANTGNLWFNDGTPQTGTDTRLGMMAGTSPSVAALPNGQFVIVFHANTRHLWVVDGTPRDTGLGMVWHTSPSIAVLPNGRYVIAFQAYNTSRLWVTDGTPQGSIDTRLEVMGSTSPSVAVLPDGRYVIAFQSSTGNLWTNDGTEQSGTDTKLAMMAATSPSIAVLPNGRYVIAFQSNNGNLWVNDGKPQCGADTGLAMRAGTSPSTAR